MPSNPGDGWRRQERRGGLNSETQLAKWGFKKSNIYGDINSWYGEIAGIYKYNIHIYIYIYIYIHIYIYVYIHIYIVHIYIYICIHNQRPMCAVVQISIMTTFFGRWSSIHFHKDSNYGTEDHDLYHVLIMARMGRRDWYPTSNGDVNQIMFNQSF